MAQNSLPDSPIRVLKRCLPSQDSAKLQKTAGQTNDNLRGRAIAALRSLSDRLPRRWKGILLICADVVVLWLALWASYALRYAMWTPDITTKRIVLAVLVPTVAVPIFIRMGLYRAVLRHLPGTILWTIARAMLLATMAWVILVFLLEMTGQGIVPRSIPLFFFVIGTFLVAGSRFAVKWLLTSGTDVQGGRRPVLIYGTGPSAVRLAEALKGDRTRKVVGFVDQDPRHHGRDLAGHRVFAATALTALINQFDVEEIVLSISSIAPEVRHAVIAEVTGLGITARMLPDIADIVEGRYIVSQIREIELDELLGRSFVPPDPELLKSVLANRVVMVTGAGGSIGSELCRLVAKWKPEKLILFEANEYALYNIDRELSATRCEIVPFLGSVTDKAAVRRAIVRHGVHVVYHAAAHKHVPLLEENVLEGIRNNVLGTLTVAEVAFEQNVGKFVLISSDKAVRPTNVMGATKRWAELIVRQKATDAQNLRREQIFCAVRFGNVIGSNGSVVPLFKEQIGKGGPVTVTDPDMTRYFMSIPEAAQLIVQSSALSVGGDIFLLDMGDPIRIGDLAANMIRLAGFKVRNEQNPHNGIAIQVTGARPGEKLFEELFYDRANAKPTKHPKILTADAGVIQQSRVTEALDRLTDALRREDELAAKDVLFSFIADRESKAA
jgi:FlaA1/EpsC-like NDP-sugar epimerase